MPVLSASQEFGIVKRSDVGIDIKYDKNTLVNYKRVQVDQFVISLRSFQGGFELSHIEGIVSPAYTIFTFLDGMKQNQSYWEVVFKTYRFIESLKKVTFGIRDGKAISFKEFGDVKVSYPVNVDEQKRIGSLINSTKELITLHQ